MKTTEIIPLARVRVRHRCPKCERLSVKRGATRNEAALWDLSESCTMCPWSHAYIDVQIGA